MLKKKNIVQKTFRLDADINDDFETLCDILERTQNDLANVAIQDLIEDNKYWIAKNILVDYASDYFYNFNDVNFEVENIKVEIKEKDSDIVYLKITHKDDEGNLIQEVEKEYHSDIDKDYDRKIEKQLRYFGTLIDYNSETVQRYLKEKLNYK